MKTEQSMFIDENSISLDINEHETALAAINDTLSDDDFLSINVCGMKYETLKRTLEQKPNTLLGCPEKRRRHYVKSKNAYFFDRNRECFEAILYYYQSGELLRPPNIPMHLFTKEVSFFDLGEETLTKLKEQEGYFIETFELPQNPWQRRVWELFETPDSSLAARVVASWSVVVIAVSITVFCMETMPMFNKKTTEPTYAPCVNNATNCTEVPFVNPDYRQPWFALELGCIVWFTIEYVVRFLASPSKWKFSKSFLNVIDLLAILPYFITMSIDSRDTTPLSVLRVVRLVRVFRIFKLSRHSLGLQILGHTLQASISELAMLIFFLFLGVILFSSAIFYAEQGSNDDMFGSIPQVFWYSLVTMTTVGYGDIVPKTLTGKLIGSLCAVSGVLTIALPVPVIVSNFEYFYKRDHLNHNKRLEAAAEEAGSSESEERPEPHEPPGYKDDNSKEELLNGGTHGTHPNINEFQ